MDIWEAIKSRNLSYVKQTLKNDADTNAKRNGKTPLIYALELVNIRNHKGESAIDTARSRGHTDIVRMCENHIRHVIPMREEQGCCTLELSL